MGPDDFPPDDEGLPFGREQLPTFDAEAHSNVKPPRCMTFRCVRHMGHAWPHMTDDGQSFDKEAPLYEGPKRTHVGIDLAKRESLEDCNARVDESVHYRVQQWLDAMHANAGNLGSGDEVLGKLVLEARSSDEDVREPIDAKQTDITVTITEQLQERIE